MAANVLKTTTNADSPLDGHITGAKAESAVSDFLTIQSFTNFAAMTGAITAAWNALQRLTPAAAAVWVPYVFALGWGFVSLLISIEGLKKNKDGTKTVEPGTLVAAIFIALVNSLVLAGAVVGTNIVTTATR